jgi:hypothetical protein
MKREASEKRKLSETHNTSKEESSKPSSHIKPHSTLKQPHQTECLFVSRSDLRDVRNTTTPFFVLLYKEVLFSTNDLPSSLPSVVLDLLQDFEDVFPNEVQLDFPHFAALSIKLTWSLVLLFQIVQPTAPIPQRQRKFSDR